MSACRPRSPRGRGAQSTGCWRLAEPPGWEGVRRGLAEARPGAAAPSGLRGPAAAAAATARLVAEGRFVVAGLPVVGTVFAELDRSARVVPLVAEGAWSEPGAVIATVHASASALLAGERVALNFLQHLSGVATLTRRAVEAVAGTSARITHTRKTTPGLRALELYAIRLGGGVDNRASLADAVLWKDNHWALLAGGSLRAALEAVQPGVPVMVEVENDAQLEAALAARVRHLLVDNQPPERLAAWARRAGPQVTIQASGGITPGPARAYAGPGA